MSFRLIDANELSLKYPEVNNMPCIYADLPNGLDNRHYNVLECKEEFQKFKEANHVDKT